MLTVLLILSMGLLQATPQAENAVRVDYDVPPRLLKQKKPSYPDDAFRKRIEGVVLVEFVIDTDGRVQHPKVLKSVPGLDQAAIKALEKWRFAPAQKNGKPVATIAQSPMSFCIDDKPCSGRPASLKDEQ